MNFPLDRIAHDSAKLLNFGQHFLQDAPMPIVICDANFRVLYYNPAARELMGIPKEAQPPAIGRDVRELGPFSPQKIEKITQAILKGESVELEFDYTSLYGKSLHVQLKMRGVFSHGKLDQITMFLNDLTKTNAALQKAKASETRYRLLLGNMTDRVFRIDRDFRLTYLSQPPLDISAGDEPFPFQRLVFPEDWPTIREKFNQVLCGELLEPFEMRLKAPNGEVIPVEISLKGVQNNHKEVVEIQGSARNIAGRLAMLRQLKASEAQFRNIAEKFQSGIAIVREGSFFYVNPAAAAILGYRRKEIYRKSWRDFILPEDRAMVEKAYSNISAKNEGQHFEVRIYRKNGEVRWLEYSFGKIEIENKSAVLVNLNDITERKLMELQLRQSEEKYRNLVESEVTGFFVYDGQKFLYFNEYLTKITEYSAEEMKNMQVWDFFIHPEEIQKLQENAKLRMQGGSPPPLIEFSIRTKTGKIRHILGYVSYVTYENQPAIQGILLDITEKKELEKRLAEQAHLFDAIYNATNNGLSVITPDYRIEMANATAEKLYGPDLKGKHCYEVYQKRQSVCPFCPTRRTFETGLPQSEVVPFPSEENPEGYISLNTFPLKDENGKVTRVIENYQDISEQKKLEEKLLQAQKMESVGILAAGIAHDFNNLLGGIIGYASLLQAENNLKGEELEMVDGIIQTAQRASTLTRQLLGFARKGKYENKPVSLNEVLEETYQIISHRLQKKIAIRKQFTTPLPAVMGDASQFQQVILNICLNAIDAMPSGGTLTLLSDVVENTPHFRKQFPKPTAPIYVHIAIQDTGSGMDKQTISKIFDPFFTTKAPGKGTGLGLSMVYGIVKNHSGFIDVESEQGKGTTFHIYLPGVPQTGKKQTTRTALKNFGRRGGHILIVDDEDVIRTVLERMLKRMGFSVVAARNGQEAIRIFQESEKDFDLIIIDMLMPVLDGKETFQILKSLDPTVRVLLATGYSMDRSAQELMEAGVLGYLHKPFNIQELSEKIQSLLEEKEKKQPVETVAQSTE